MVKLKNCSVAVLCGSLQEAWAAVDATSTSRRLAKRPPPARVPAAHVGISGSSERYIGPRGYVILPERTLEERKKRTAVQEENLVEINKVLDDILKRRKAREILQAALTAAEKAAENARTGNALQTDAEAANKMVDSAVSEISELVSINQLGAELRKARAFVAKAVTLTNEWVRATQAARVATAAGSLPDLKDAIDKLRKIIDKSN